MQSAVSFWLTSSCQPPLCLYENSQYVAIRQHVFQIPKKRKQIALIVRQMIRIAITVLFCLLIYLVSCVLPDLMMRHDMWLLGNMSDCICPFIAL